MNAGATLNGTGVTTGSISGAGSYEPGNSAGILTAASLDPSAGTDFAFEIGGTNPNYGSVTSSTNDVLRITSASTPFASALGATNNVNVYFNLTSISLGNTFTGGFFTDLASDFQASIANASYNYYYLGDGNGTAVTYNGVGYYSLAAELGFSMQLSTTAATAAFAGGTVNGRVMTLSTVNVPEPSTYVLGAVATAVAAWCARRRRASKC